MTRVATQEEQWDRERDYRKHSFVPKPHWLETTYDIKHVVDRAVSNQSSANEVVIRGLLERWVSELEPAVAYDRCGNILGLCDKAAPLGSKPFILRPHE